MRILLLTTLLITISIFVAAQKKPLDHTVYDGWQSIGERTISDDGKWVIYTINPQEGDNELVIQSSDAAYKRVVPRGYNAVITEDSRFAIFRIRPYFKETREARIKKKKPEEMPKDSFAILELGKDQLVKVAKVKGYKTPEDGIGWVAYHLEKKEEKGRPTTATPNKKTVDSLQRTIDSLMHLLQQQPAPEKKKRKKDEETIDNIDATDAEGDDPVFPPTPEGTDLVLKNLYSGKETIFPLISEYHFNKTGKKLVMEMTRNAKDSLSKAAVILVDLMSMHIDTISRGGNDFRGFAFTEDGSQLAFVAERNAKPKDLQRFFRVWYYKDGMDTATMLVDKASVGMKVGLTVSEFGVVSFSKTGKRVFFGTAPIQPPKDTSLVEIDLVKLDIWHYNDDYLQPTQLNRLQRDLQENFLAMYDLEKNQIKQIGSKELPTIYMTKEGDGDLFVAVTDTGRRVSSQWTGSAERDVYAIDINKGTTKLVVKDLHGVITQQYISPNGKYIAWYDRPARHYYVYDGDEVRNITKNISLPLWNEEFDNPDDPPPYGLMRWKNDDDALFIYDKYSVWKVDPRGIADPELFVGGRDRKISYRYVPTDPDERFIRPGQSLVFRTFNDNNKSAGLYEYKWLSRDMKPVTIVPESPVSIGQVNKAENENLYIFTKESYVQSPDLYVAPVAQQAGASDNVAANLKLSAINPQQQNYNWGTAEIFKWKAYTGKEVEGILYKPEDFDPKKKYPMIAYFYETHSDGLHQYNAPSPTPSRLNISFFVSRGYIVFSPDIHYGTGHPARDCYNHVVSGVRAIVKQGYVDSTKLGIQGQSWGGIQVAQLVTMTNLFSAAWAGAPVANMTSAYGGIRWESGLNRQFQYEKSQSRIGATLWERPELYIENSPLFHLPKVKTPLVIMHNDADGAVPWYQGIELFTGLRRLGKKVWLLNYNGEAHNLIERKNRKDIQIREQQFFDWLLKGERPAKWITDGVPAVKKGKEWGLETSVF